MLFRKLYTYYIYYFNAVNHFRLHSPLIYDFYFKVLSDQRHFYAFELLEKYRNIVLIPFLSEMRSPNFLEKNEGDPGNRLRHINDLRTSAYYDIFTFKLTNWYQPDHIIDIHSSPCMTSQYLHSAIRSAPVMSIPMDETANIVIKKTNSELASQNINLYNIEALADHGALLKPNSFQKVLISVQTALTNKTVMKFLQKYLRVNKNQQVALVIKGIHDTRAEEEAWKMLTILTDAKYTIDVFHSGIILISPKIKEKKDFTLIKFATKPIPW